MISYANAYGLMQLLPSVGKAMAKRGGHHPLPDLPAARPRDQYPPRHRYLRHMMEHVRRHAGVRAGRLQRGRRAASVEWEAAGPYSGIDEFVESIPFTQTREYVQGILRNEEIYRSIDAAASAQTHASVQASR